MAENNLIKKVMIKKKSQFLIEQNEVIIEIFGKKIQSR